MDQPSKKPELEQNSAEGPKPAKGPKSAEGPKSADRPESHSPLEPVYQNFQEVPLKYVDFFIGICVAALILVVVVGVLKGNGII